MPWKRARVRSVPAAIAGAKGKTESAVMMLSRPNNVANHGMPAMMKVPPASCEMIDIRSHSECRSSESKSVLLAVILRPLRLGRAICCCLAASAPA